MTVTNSELVIYSNQRIPGFEKVRAMAAELLDARQRLERLETELQQAKTAATYGAKMAKDFYRDPGFTVAPLKEIRIIREVEVK